MAPFTEAQTRVLHIVLICQFWTSSRALQAAPSLNEKHGVAWSFSCPSLGSGQQLMGDRGVMVMAVGPTPACIIPQIPSRVL